MEYDRAGWGGNLGTAYFGHLMGGGLFVSLSTFNGLDFTRFHDI